MEGSFQTEAGNVLQHNLSCQASQGPALLLGDGAELGFNNPVENYTSGSEMMVQYVGTQRCARVTCLPGSSWLLCGPTTNSAGVPLYNTHVFNVNDGTDDVDLDIRCTLSIWTSIANSYVRKTGAGTLRLNSGASTFRGTTIIRSGRLLVTANVPKSGNSVLGNCTNDVVIGDSGTGANDLPTFAFDGPANSAFTFERGIVTYATNGTSAIGCISNAHCTFSGPITVSNALQLLSVTTGTNALFVTGGIAGPGSVTIANTGTVCFAAANTYTGATTVAAGTLCLGASERIADASPLRLTGGTFALAGYSETMGPLDVDGNAVIDFGAGASALAFAASAAQTWTGTLTIRNWSGAYSGGGSDRFFVGTSGQGLTKTQLAKIVFPVGQGTRQLATGEVVPIPQGTVIFMK